jgi:hypothetical protein
MKILIENLFSFHYEIIETIINKYDMLFNIVKKNDIIILNIIKNDSFNNYILSKYKNIKLCTLHDTDYDYYINCTIYDKNVNEITNDNKHIYIAHEITENLKKYQNIYFLTPLCNTNKFFYADILPYSEQKKINKVPIFIIQGNLTDRRRNYKLLDKILDYQTDLKFYIKIIGKGSLDPKYKKHTKLIIKENLNFQDYHKEFLDVYCIIPLITKQSHSQYYKNKLTSSINYGKAYNLKFLIDKNLQDIYNLSNVEIFIDEKDFLIKFIKCVNDFYSINSKIIDTNKE